MKKEKEEGKKEEGIRESGKVGRDTKENRRDDVEQLFFFFFFFAGGIILFFFFLIFPIVNKIEDPFGYHLYSISESPGQQSSLSRVKTYPSSPSQRFMLVIHFFIQVIYLLSFD